MLFFGLIMNICAQLENLRESIDIDDKKSFVKNHQNILRLANELNELVKPVIFVLFLFGSLLLCVIGFQLMTIKSASKKIAACSFGITIIIQLFIYNYAGQEIRDKSSSVAGNFYKPDKDFLIIIARSQKPLEIKSAFYNASLPTFRLILSSTASLFTLLQSFL